MLTVVIASTGRPESLSRTLSSLVSINKPKADWRVDVVVNGGDQKTFEAALKFEDRLPIQCFLFSEYGKNRALNQVVGKITSGLVVFTDDDIEFDENWLTTWERVIDTCAPNLIFSGLVDLKMDTVTSQKIIELELSTSFLFSKTEIDSDGLDSGERCCGGNMAIHSDIFKSGYRFSEAIGPDGTWKYPMGSEVELCTRLERAGYKVKHYPGPKVFHFVRSKQLENTALWARYFRSGRSAYLCRRRDKLASFVPVAIFVGLFFSALRPLKKKYWRDKKYQVQSLIHRAFLQGQVYEYFFPTNIS